MNHYGLLMMRGDLDILREVMSKNSPFFDEIYVLDGTEDHLASSEIIKSFKNVVFYVRDVDLGKQYHPIGAGARKVLYDELASRHPGDGWVTLLHSDEIFYDANPRVVAEESDALGFDHTIWRNVHFFLHSSEESGYSFDPSRPASDQVTWACFPGWGETRQFKNAKGLFYRQDQVLRVDPYGTSRPRFTSYPIRHYLYRDPDQMRKNNEDRSSRGWQHYGQWMNGRSCFTDCLPGYEFSKKIGPHQRIKDGIMGEVESLA